MIIQHYRIHGVNLRLEVPQGALADAAAALLGLFAVADTPATACRIAIRQGKPPVMEDGLTMVDSTVLTPGAEIRHYADAHRRITHGTGVAWCRLDLLQAKGEIVVAPGKEWCLEGDCLTPMLCELLAGQGHHMLHGATLVGQAGNGSRAIVLAGVSGTGKTTTALALARAGLPLLTDDATFLFRRNDGLKVSGLPRPCKVHRRTLAMMDWLGRLEPNPRWLRDEFLLPLRRASAADPNTELSPGLLVLLEPRNAKAHRFEKWDRLEALTEMTRQNVRSIRGMASEAAGDCFARISDLVAGSRTLRLSVGPDLPSLAAALQEKLEK